MTIDFHHGLQTTSESQQGSSMISWFKLLLLLLILPSVYFYVAQSFHDLSLNCPQHSNQGNCSVES